MLDKVLKVMVKLKALKKLIANTCASKLKPGANNLKICLGKSNSSDEKIKDTTNKILVIEVVYLFRSLVDEDSLHTASGTKPIIMVFASSSSIRSGIDRVIMYASATTSAP